MGSSLFGTKQIQIPVNNPAFNIQARQIVSMLKGANGQTILSAAMQQNPELRNFMEKNKGRAPEEVAQEMGVDYNFIRNLLG